MATRPNGRVPIWVICPKSGLGPLAIKPRFFFFAPSFALSLLFSPSLFFSLIFNNNNNASGALGVKKNGNWGGKMGIGFVAVGDHIDHLHATEKRGSVEEEDEER